MAKKLDTSDEKKGSKLSNNKYFGLSYTFAITISKLYLNEKCADLTFFIEGERVPAHSLILAGRNKYFRSLIFLGCQEPQKTEFRLDVNLEAFKGFLRYIYTHKLNVRKYDENVLVSILRMTAEYDCVDLRDKIFIGFCNHLNLTTVFMFAEAACLYKFTILLEKCLHFIDLNIEEIMHPNFFKPSLSKELLCEIIGRNSFSIDEWKLFEEILFWGKDKNRSDIRSVLCYVRFSLLQIDQIRLDVARTNLLSTSEIEDIIMSIKTLEQLPFRLGKLHRNEIVPSKIGLNEALCIYFKDRKKVYVLEKKQNLNHIKLDIDRKLKYRVTFNLEVSSDLREWTRICNERSCLIRNHYFNFPEQEVKYIYLEFLGPIRNEFIANIEMKYDNLKYFRHLST